MKFRLEQILAYRLRELAQERGLLISHVADRCGLAHSYFWQLLAAKASPTLAVVQRLADALEVDALVLLGAKDETRASHRSLARQMAKRAPKSPQGSVRGVKRAAATPR